MSGRGHGGGDKRPRRGQRDARSRNRQRRGEKVRPSNVHEVTTCPGCLSHLPALSGFSETPELCPECGHRLECGSCGGSTLDMRFEEGADRQAGPCPRCNEPLDGSDTGPASEDFTWGDQ